MRKLLLFLSIVAFVGLSSCSRDGVTEISQEEKELLVKQTLIEFNNSAVVTGKLQNYLNSVAELKSRTANTSREELEALLQKFLGDQTQAFLDLYYQLEALNMTKEEFLSIAYLFEDLRLQIMGNLGKASSDEDCDQDGLINMILEYLKICNAEESGAAN